MRKHRASERRYVSKVPVVLAACAGVAALSFAASPGTAAAQYQDNESIQQTPIKHVIVIVDHNRTFDHMFGTYKPLNGQSVHNLLSQLSFNADGSRGPNFAK